MHRHHRPLVWLIAVGILAGAAMLVQLQRGIAGGDEPPNAACMRAAEATCEQKAKELCDKKRGPAKQACETAAKEACMAAAKKAC